MDRNQKISGGTGRLYQSTLHKGLDYRVKYKLFAPRFAASSALAVIAPARRETPSRKARQTTSTLIAS